MCVCGRGVMNPRLVLTSVDLCYFTPPEDPALDCYYLSLFCCEQRRTRTFFRAPGVRGEAVSLVLSPSLWGSCGLWRASFISSGLLGCCLSGSTEHVYRVLPIPSRDLTEGDNSVCCSTSFRQPATRTALSAAASAALYQIFVEGHILQGTKPELLLPTPTGGIMCFLDWALWE